MNLSYLLIIPVSIIAGLFFSRLSKKGGKIMKTAAEARMAAEQRQRYLTLKIEKEQADAAKHVALRNKMMDMYEESLSRAEISEYRPYPDGRRYP